MHAEKSGRYFPAKYSAFVGTLTGSKTQSVCEQFNWYMTYVSRSASHMSLENFTWIVELGIQRVSAVCMW